MNFQISVLYICLFHYYKSFNPRKDYSCFLDFISFLRRFIMGRSFSVSELFFIAQSYVNHLPHFPYSDTRDDLGLYSVFFY